MASIEQRGERVYRVTVDRGRKRDGSRDRVKRTFRNVTSVNDNLKLPQHNN